jgi:hypothetical protein
MAFGPLLTEIARFTGGSGGLDDFPRPQATRTNPDAARAPADNRADGLQVGLEPSGADVVRVADSTSDHGRLSANLTLFGHLLVLDHARDIAPEDKRQV